MPTRVFEPAGAPVADVLIERWRGVPVTIASDVTGGQSLVDSCILPIRPLPRGMRLAGRAVTAWCERGDFGAVLHAIDRAARGDVLAVAADGRLDTAVAGDLLCGAARGKGIAGLVVDGAVRDLDDLSDWPDFPVFALGATARGPLSKDGGAVGGEIVLGGVRTAPGDLVLADNDGVLVLDAQAAERRIDAALARIAAEEGWRTALSAGRSVLDVFAVPAAERA